MTAAATGVGSLPGSDIHAAVRLVLDELPDLAHLPELPERGAPAATTGRAVGLLADLGADLQPAGWRLTGAGTPGGGVDQRRARSLLAEDLDALEEHTQGYDGRIKVQVAGPWTLAATVERPRGDRLLADHGARRDLAQSLAEGVAGHVADVRRRVPGAALVVQVDEPALPAVLAAAVPTASGFGRHRAVHEPEAAAGLAVVVHAVRSAGAAPVVHCCAGDVPIGLLAGAGAVAVSLDVSLLDAGRTDALAAAVDAGLGLWAGLPDSTETPDLLRLLERLGTDPTAADLVVTPACGLAGATADGARRTYARLRQVARQVSEAG